MATKKSTTKAKTKTTKSKTPKKPATQKTAATKSSAKTTIAPAKKTEKVLPSQSVDMATLRRLHVGAVVCFLGAALAALFFMGSQTHQLTIGHLAKDSLLSDNRTVFAPAVRVLFDVEVRWLVIVTMFMSAVLPLLYITKLEARYKERLQTSRVVPWRWIDLALTSALMVETVALLSGIQDIMALKLIGALTAVTYGLRWLGERQNNQGGAVDWSAYHISLFSGLVPWLMIAAYAVSTGLYGMVRMPWFVYALYGGGLVGFVGMAANQLKSYRQPTLNYQMIERNYVNLNVLTKLGFAVILIIGLR